MTRELLLAEELALAAVDEESGRHPLWVRSNLNACLAALLVAELVLDGHARWDERDDVVVRAGGGRPRPPTLAAAARVAEAKGPGIKPVLSHMDRGLTQELGHGTWDAVVSGLVDAGMLTPAWRGLRSRLDVINRDRRNVVVMRLRAAVEDDGDIKLRTALVLSMTGPAQLLELVAPARRARRRARRRIDHALDGSPFEPVQRVVRKLVDEAAAAAAG